MYTYPSVLTIAGFDGSGGAGLQADIKTISALGCYATSVLTSLPVQNTQGVRKIYPIGVEVVTDQLESIFDDIFPLAIKIGMLHTPELVKAVAKTMRKYPQVPIVFDPVMVATSGHRLIEEETVRTMIETLIPLVTLLTPNMDEAAVLAKMDVVTLADLHTAGDRIRSFYGGNVLLKGGHQETKMITSLFFDHTGNLFTYESEKIATNNTHGSGCTLSSAIAAYIALGHDVYDAVGFGQEYVFNAIKHGADVITGKGNGPLNHFFNPQKMVKNEMV